MDTRRIISDILQFESRQSLSVHDYDRLLLLINRLDRVMDTNNSGRFDILLSKKNPEWVSKLWVAFHDRLCGFVVFRYIHLKFSPSYPTLGSIDHLIISLEILIQRLKGNADDVGDEKKIVKRSMTAFFSNLKKLET